MTSVRSLPSRVVRATVTAVEDMRNIEHPSPNVYLWVRPERRDEDIVIVFGTIDGLDDVELAERVNDTDVGAQVVVEYTSVTGAERDVTNKGRGLSEG